MVIVIFKIARSRDFVEAGRSAINDSLGEGNVAIP